MPNDGRSTNLIRVNSNCEAYVQVQGGIADWFQVEKGVRKGCAMSLWLLNVYMDHIPREAKERFSGGVKLDDRNVQFLLFAHDLMIMAEKDEDSERNLRILDEVMTGGTLRQWL